MNNREVEEERKEMKKMLNEIGVTNDYKTVAIGWLDITEEFEKGDVPDGFVERLRGLWATGTGGLVIATMGHHDCEFCIAEGKKPTTSGSQKILRDEENKIEYIFPEMLFHYITEHGFKPPEEFVKFIMSGDENG